jgi:colanic acid/amylovoran biosynthesis glycosyltransferase
MAINAAASTGSILRPLLSGRTVGVPLPSALTHLRIAARARARWLTHAWRAAGDPEAWRRFRQAALTDVPVAVTAPAQDDFPDTVPLVTRRPRTVGAVASADDDSPAHPWGVLAGMPVPALRDGVDVSRSNGQTRHGPLLCVSRLIPEEGIDTLITAFGLLADDRPALALEIIGEGPHEEAMRGQARARGLADRVRFRGPLPSGDVQAALYRCAMLVLPGAIEEPGDPYGLPAVLLGAMACGTPVVTTDTVGLPEMVRHDATGVLVAPPEPAGLALAVATLLDDPARAATLGAAGRRLITRVHDRDPGAARLERIWQEIGR